MVLNAIAKTMQVLMAALYKVRLATKNQLG